MKKYVKHVLCLLVAATGLFICAFGSVITGGAPSNAAKAPSEIDRIVVDCRSADAFAKTSSVYVHTPTEKEPDPLTGGKYSFNSVMNAMEVEYNPAQKPENRFRVMTQFNNKNTVTEEYKYFVIVYAAMTDKPYELTLWNGGKHGEKVTVTSNGKDTKAKFVVSDPFDAAITNDAQGRSTMWRWSMKIHCTITFNCEDADARFFIKEYAFFKTPEDARAYYAGVDLNKDPEEYGKNAVPGGSSSEQVSTGAQSSQSALTTPSGKGLINMVYQTLPDPEPSEKTDEVKAPSDEPRLAPVIMSFEGKEAFDKTGRFSTFTGDLEGIDGISSFVTLADGTSCLKLEKLEYEGFADYRVISAFNTGNTPSTKHKYVRITYMTTDTVPNSITLRNNAKAAETYTLVSDTSVSKGNFVTSQAVNIEGSGILSRYNQGTHNAIGYVSLLDNSNIYIKEIALFTSLDQAYEYYGDKPMSDSINYTELKFGETGNAVAATDDPSWGNNYATANTLDIIYAESTNVGGAKYMAKIKPLEKNTTSKDQRFMRILYSAENPEGIEKVSMLLHCDSGADPVRRLLISDSVTDTNGLYALTEPILITELMAERFSKTIFNTLIFNASEEGGKYSIKSIYFFDTREDAEAFSANVCASKLTINGNDISNYQIVVAEDAPANVVSAAETVASAITQLTGVKIPVVTDTAPVSGYEILVGQSNRPKTTARMEELMAKGDFNYTVYVDGNDLVYAGAIGLTVPSAVAKLNPYLFYEGAAKTPGEINIPADFVSNGADTQYRKANFWEKGEAVSDPDVLYVDFSSDEGYFSEDNGENNWKYDGGAYKVSAKGLAASFVHVFEKNLTYKAKLSYTNENGGSMGLVARYNSRVAYIKAGYDFNKCEWFVDYREGNDFYVVRAGAAKASVSPSTEYELILTLDGSNASLSVNGNTVITCDVSGHMSPGRPGLFAEDADISVDSVEVTLTSGMGTVWQNAYNTMFEDSMLQGGSFQERDDGTLLYVHNSEIAYKSLDDGRTWLPDEPWSDTYKQGKINMMRLNDGTRIRIVSRTVDNVRYMASQTSTDDGMTWVDGGLICEYYFNGSTARALNMNDKITQTKGGRILYGQAYETTKANGMVDGRYIFCSYFYSDDNGKTWQKSDTDSWEIEGVEGEQYFGENKLLECADGSIRMYASWHMLGYVVYSESTDGGKTFGPIQYLYNMPTPTSSMQFVKDTYADNDYTYYMVWLNAEPQTAAANSHQPRSCLSLARSTDGKNWVYLGEAIRWEGTYMVGSTLINHIINPSIGTTEDSVIIGCGFSIGKKHSGETGSDAHQSQRQFIVSVRKDSLPEGKPLD